MMTFDWGPGVYLRSGMKKIHCFKADSPLSNGKQEFTERVAAFFFALEQAVPIDENHLFADLEPDIHEEELNEIVVYKD